MKMRFFISLFAFSILVIMNSCEEKVQKIEEVDIIGFWEGTYKIDGRPEVEPQYMNFLIKSDGTVTNEGVWFSSQRINLGTWELKDSTFKFNISNAIGGEGPNPQVGSAIFVKSGKLVNGKILNLSGSTSASFEMEKLK
jgi:hypothetical protein